MKCVARTTFPDTRPRAGPRPERQQPCPLLWPQSEILFLPILLWALGDLCSLCSLCSSREASAPILLGLE